MVDSATKKKIVQKIVASPVFFKNDTLKNLLHFLVKCANKRLIPNEIDIATQVFNRDKSFNPSEDPFVRVYIYKLRKKIEEYYQGPGRKDKVRLIIPKGHYNVEFIDNSKKKINISRKIFSAKTLTITVVLILLSANAAQWIHLHKVKNNSSIESNIRNSLIWSSFFNNEFPTDIVFGDFFLFQEYDKLLQRKRAIIDYLISDNAEFQSYQRLFPHRINEKANVGDIPHNSIYNLKDILNVFYSYRKKCNLKMSSEYSDDDLFNHNIIYIGAFKNLRKLKKLLFNLPIEYRYNYPWTWDGELFIKGENSDSIMHWSTNVMAEKEYKVNLEVLAKLPGPNGENYLIIAGFGYASHIEVVRMLSYPEYLMGLEKDIKQGNNGVFPRYFMIVFQVTSFQRQPFKTDLKYFKEINSDYFKEF